MSECFWQDRFGVTENCGAGGGSDIPAGVYLYVVWGGLFGTRVEVRKYLIYDQNGPVTVDPVGIRVAGSGQGGTDPASLNRPSGLAAQVELDGKVHMYVGEYTGYSHWVEGELERRTFLTSPGGYRVTAITFDHNNDLALGVSNFAEIPNNPPTFLSNWIVGSGGTSLGYGNGRWATSEFDLMALNGVCGVSFQKNGVAWTHDAVATNYSPVYRGRISMWGDPGVNSTTVFTEAFPGSISDPRELSGQIQVVDFGNNGTPLEYLFFCHAPRQTESPFDVEMNIKSLWIDEGEVRVEVPFGVWGTPYLSMAGMAVAHFSPDFNPSSTGPKKTLLMAAMQTNEQRYDIILADISDGPATSYQVIVPGIDSSFPGQFAIVVVQGEDSGPPPEA